MGKSIPTWIKYLIKFKRHKVSPSIQIRRKDPNKVTPKNCKARS